jgi:hypothetical protein
MISMHYRGDLDAVRECFSDDVVNVDPLGSLKGWDVFRQLLVPRSTGALGSTGGLQE